MVRCVGRWSCRSTTCFILALAVAAGVARAADWPAYRHDMQRSAVTDEQLSFPLKLAWSYTCAQPPAPAWGEQLNLVNRVDFDYAPHPVIAGGLLCFGSSSDDTVRALDAATGKEKWHFITGGPVRLAPQIAGDKVYFSSDDGKVYCLSAADGKLVWSFRPSPADERMVGNARMISRWPVRTGVLVADGVAYCAGGMWNTEGVFIYALAADTGKVLWCNDTTGFGGLTMVDYATGGINEGHQGEFYGSGPCPQGALAASDRVLVVPNGFSGPTKLDRATGKAMHREPGGPPGSGGSWVTVDGDSFYSFAYHGQGGLVLCLWPYSLSTGKLGPKGWAADRIPQSSIGPQLKPSESHEKVKVSAIVHNGIPYARRAYGIAMAGPALLLGQDGAVTAERAEAVPSAQLRFGLAGDDLAVLAAVADGKVRQDATPWKGSCVEVFGSMPGKSPIGQIFLVPGTAGPKGEPARAYRIEGGKIVAAAEIRVQSTATETGYEMSALVPLTLLALNKANPDFRLEAQVTIPGADGTTQRESLFGSESAYQDSARFGQFRLSQQAAIASADKVNAALAAVKPSVIKMSATGEIWRSKVDGEAREIAVADGRLFVATQRGVIYCFEPAAKDSGKTAVMHDPGAAARAAAWPPASGMSSTAVDQVRQARVDRGMAMVLGDADGQLSMALAVGTRLHVVNVMTDEAAADRLRQRLLDQTAWYGSRIHVATVDRLDGLPFAQFFANVIVVAGPADGLSGKELYRVLHPCGGTLLCPGLNGDQAARLAKDSGAGEQEIGKTQGDALIVRGKLPGALDWDSAKDVSEDKRVKWPMRPLWFGGPSTLQIREFRQGADGPCVANGRYFIKSENALTAVDAYNGAVLWSRPIPSRYPDLRSRDRALFMVSEPNASDRKALWRNLRVNDDSVYLMLGPAFFREQGPGTIELDARTGEQKKVYCPFIAPAPVSLSARQTWPVAVDANHSGVVSMEDTAAGLVITLTTKDPAVTKLDAWELFFDFRQPAARYGLYERGAFHIRVTVAQDGNVPPSWVAAEGLEHPPIEVSGARQADGTRTVVVLPWAGIGAIAGTKSAKLGSFAFAATLNSHDGGRVEPIVRRHLFGDWAADGLNNGWATVATAANSPTADAGTPPAVVAGTAKDMKDRTGFVGAGGRDIPEAVRQTPRIHPLTGEAEPIVCRVSTLCGGAYFSEYLMSGRAGMYDYADDSGLRFVGGVKARCTSPEVVALGMVLVSEESGHCSCNWPFRTTAAWAPAERRLNEDWALYHDRPADTKVRQAAVNLGAPGDRRDDHGTLWLGFPRPPGEKSLGYSLQAGRYRPITANGVWMRGLPGAMQIPLEIECFGGDDAYRPADDSQTFWNWMTVWALNRHQNELGPYRINSDRAKIEGTDRPWIYASNLRGIRKAVMRLDFLQPLATAAAAQPPATDGKLDEAAWSGNPQAVLPFTKTDVLLRHDAEHLFIAARRPPYTNKLGEPSPWMARTAGQDANVWLDDSLEVFISDANGGRVVHFGISASGARYDALAGTGAEEDKAWNGAWAGAAKADANALSFELAIPWKTLADAGLTKERLAVNVQINQMGANAEALCNLGIRGRKRCEHFTPLGIGALPVAVPRSFAVRLHFCELDEKAKPGQRVFDVKLQGQTVLKDFDIVKEAGVVRTALVKEFKGVKATGAMTLEFVPAGKDITPATAPILSAIDVMEEGFVLPSTAKH